MDRLQRLEIKPKAMFEHLGDFASGWLAVEEMSYHMYHLTRQLVKNTLYGTT